MEVIVIESDPIKGLKLINFFIEPLIVKPLSKPLLMSPSVNIPKSFCLLSVTIEI